MITIFNLDYLVSIEIHKQKVCNDFQYLPLRPKTFWKKERPAGLYNINWYGCEPWLVDAEELRIGKVPDYGKMIVEENIVYWRPYIKLRFVDGTKRVRNHDTYDSAESEAKQYAAQAMKNITYL